MQQEAGRSHCCFAEPTCGLACLTDGSCSHGQTAWCFAVSTTFTLPADGPVLRSCPAPAPPCPCPSCPNLAEIQAVIEALDWLLSYHADISSHIFLFTDSDYVLGFWKVETIPPKIFTSSIGMPPPLFSSSRLAGFLPTPAFQAMNYS